MQHRLNTKTNNKHHSLGDDVNTSVFVSIFLLFFGIFAILVSFRSDTSLVDEATAEVSSQNNSRFNEDGREQMTSVGGDAPDRLINSMTSIHGGVRQNAVQFEEGAHQVVAFKIPASDLFSQNGVLPKPSMRFFIERLILFSRDNKGVLSNEQGAVPLILDISLGTDQRLSGASNEIIKQRLAFLSEQLTERLAPQVVFRQGVIDASRDSLYVTISLPKTGN